MNRYANLGDNIGFFHMLESKNFREGNFENLFFYHSNSDNTVRSQKKLEFPHVFRRKMFYTSDSE